MPIYAYKCESCGHAKDVLQKMSDVPLTDCPACGATSFKKQLTAAGFQLKGSGWYATDFKGGGAAPAPAADQAGSGSGTTGDTQGNEARNSDKIGSEAKGTDSKGNESKSESKGMKASESKSESKSDTKAARPAAPTAASKPSDAAPGKAPAG